VSGAGLDRRIRCQGALFRMYSPSCSHTDIYTLRPQQCRMSLHRQ
jgi:hypothetical protein